MNPLGRLAAGDVRAAMLAYLYFVRPTPPAPSSESADELDEEDEGVAEPA